MASAGTRIYMGAFGNGTQIYFGASGNGTAVWEAAFGNGTQVYEGAFGNGTQVWLAGCFPKTELVQTFNNELTPITALQVGDKLRSWDTERGKVVDTEIVAIHDRTVNELITFNNNLCVSPSHPMMVFEYSNKKVSVVPKWKTALDVNIGDCLVSADGTPIIITSRLYKWFNGGISVIDLSTDKGLPFSVKGCIVRAYNANDDIKWTDGFLTKQVERLTLQIAG